MNNPSEHNGNGSAYQAQETLGHKPRYRIDPAAVARSQVIVMDHWMTRAVHHAGFSRAEELVLSADTPIQVVWETAATVCDVSSRDLAAAVADLFRLKTVDLDTAEPTAVKLVPDSLARTLGVFPIRDMDRCLVLAVSDPTDPDIEREVGFSSGRRLSLRVAPPGDLSKAIEAAYPPDRAAASLLAQLPIDVGSSVELRKEDKVEEVTEEEIESAPIVRLLKTVLQKAVELGASDIHIQPGASSGIVRFRVDGVLRAGLQMPLSVMVRVISRIKILANLDIADRLRPQDGRARIKVHDRSYDLRISTVPTRKAEKAVIRVLDPQRTRTLSETGIAEHDLERIRASLAHRDGIVVMTGPTGSGKTTTLHSALCEIATEDMNIMSVEDPVEYELPGMTQIQVEETQGVTFASALRAILRQDPDVIVVGEIRDQETAEVAAQASLTGHLVLATVHAHDAVGVIRRFIDLGLDTATVTETLRGALSQRLLRIVCNQCKVHATDPLTPEEESLWKLYGTRPVVRAVGCESCAQQGYAGRIPVTEFLTVSDELVQLVIEGAPQSDLKKQAMADGMTTLLSSALARVSAGATTLEEVARVVGGSSVAQDPTAVTETQQTSVAGTASASLLGTAPYPALDTSRDNPDPADDAPHILLVDDDSMIRTFARALLEKEGYRVSESPDGSDGLARLARGEYFDLMVLDLTMPMLGGREVLQAVRRTVETAGLTVVVLTGTLDPAAEVELLGAGADDYIRKPLDPSQFLMRIQAALRRAGG